MKYVISEEFARLKGQGLSWIQSQCKRGLIAHVKQPYNRNKSGFVYLIPMTEIPEHLRSGACTIEISDFDQFRGLKKLKKSTAKKVEKIDKGEPKEKKKQTYCKTPKVRKMQGVEKEIEDSSAEVSRRLEERTASLQEAVRTLKIEQTLKIKYENELKAKTLIDYEKLSFQIRATLRNLMEGLHEEVEKWGMIFDLTPKQIKTMLTGLDVALKSSFEKIKCEIG